MSTPEPLQLAPPRGRPLLHWVGKRPPGQVHYYPAQATEACQVQNPPAQPSWEALQHNWCNLLFHGDNKEILSTLIVNGFRGQVELVYIDPPFDSGANYVRKVALRGRKAQVLEGRGYSLGEDLQYEDIWANDTYLQYMYERLILLRELLSERGSIYLHCDWHKAHHLRFLMDEIFGQDNFIDEIIWCYGSPSGGRAKGAKFVKNHENIFHYAKYSAQRYEKKIYIPYSDKYIENWFRWTDKSGRKYRRRMRGRDANNKIIWERQYLDQSKGMPCPTVWLDVLQVYADPRAYKDNTASELDFQYPTQKPEALLERIVEASSDDGAIVLDCFCGSGTTAAAAENLGRRWIAADMNKGAIQTTAKRLRTILAKNNQQAELAARTRRYGFSTYRVNNYDFKEQHKIRQIIEARYGLERIPSDLFFDGQINGQLVKIAELNRPLVPRDVEEIREELHKRPDETRSVVLIGYGTEPALDRVIKEHNRLIPMGLRDSEKSDKADKTKEEKAVPINKITMIDVQTDRILSLMPAEAEVEFTPQGDSMQVAIKNYLSPTILSRLELDRTVFGEEIEDFRAQIDCVLLDVDYDGQVFRIHHDDIPSRKNDLVKGKYSVKLPRPEARVALKIIDLLGEEVLVVSDAP